MYRYHPRKAPESGLWLSLDEQECIRLVEVFHRAERIKIPNARAHAIFHAVVENQIAEGMASVVHAMQRLQDQGLSRHECIHAVGSVAAQHFHAVMQSTGADGPEVALSRYNAAIEQLDAPTWRAQARRDGDGGAPVSRTR